MQTQFGSGGACGGLRRTKQAAPGFALTSGQQQPPQIGESEACFRQPAEHGAASAGAERLLHGPKRLALIPRTDQQHFGDIHPEVAQRRRIGHEGRHDQRDCPRLVPAQRRERRRQQAQFADAAGGAQQFRQSRPRPTAMQEGGIQCGEAGMHSAFVRLPSTANRLRQPRQHACPRRRAGCRRIAGAPHAEPGNGFRHGTNLLARCHSQSSFSHSGRGEYVDMNTVSRVQRCVVARKHCCGLGLPLFGRLESWPGPLAHGLPVRWTGMGGSEHRLRLRRNRP